MLQISNPSIKRFFYILLFSLLSTPFANAQNWPSRTITIIVPYAPGATDQEARRLAEMISKNVGHPVVVENKEGAGGAIGAQFVARSKPDGYTFLYAAPAVITIAPLLGNASYKYDDLVPVARTTSAPHILASRSDAPFKNINDLKPLIAHELTHTAMNHVRWRDDDHDSEFNYYYNKILLNLD